MKQPVKPFTGPRDELQRARTKLLELEWSYTVQGDEEAYGSCPDCGVLEYKKHKSDCELGALCDQARLMSK